MGGTQTFTRLLILRQGRAALAAVSNGNTATLLAEIKITALGAKQALNF